MYFKVALRNLRREKLYATLNVAGFALGIGACLILALYLWDEFNYDRHHVNDERIYRVVQHTAFANGDERIETSYALGSAAVGPMLAEDFPSVVEQYVRFSQAGGGSGRTLLRNGGEVEYWSDAYLADDNVFDVFTHEILYGDARTALTQPSTVAISRTVAERYFGRENPVGRTLENAVGTPFTVTLVFEDLPANSHLRYDVLYAYKGAFATPDDVNARRQMLNQLAAYTYVMLPDGYDAGAWAALSEQFADRHMADRLGPNGSWESALQPLADIHFQSGIELDRPTSNPLYLYAFAAVGLSLLLITCINYVNLATARAAKRAQTIGLRKILGADRGALVAQCLGESVLFALLATALGVVAAKIVISLPPVTALVGKSLELDLLGNPLLAAAIAAFGTLIGFVAGLYPALYLSAFVPVTAFSTRYKTVGGLRLREALVFVQFMISVGVIAATLVMTAQMRYVAEQALGFDAANRVVVPLRGADLIEQHEVLATELAKNPSVLGVTTSDTIMGRDVVRSTSNDVETDDGATRRFLHQDVGQVGADFISVMGLVVIEGRDFSGTSGTEADRPVIVNETFVREMGWDEPIGKQIGRPGGRFSGRVIGVVEDYHFRSLHERIAPFAIFRGDGQDYSNSNALGRAGAQRLMIVNVAQEGLRETLQYIRQTVEALEPSRPFELSFLDEELDRLYTTEARLMAMIGTFAGICILVACLGLFGLSAFTTEQRTKEIGIRKVLGASVGAIVLLLSRRTLLLIAAAGAVACVVAWNVMEDWLSGFAYRADIHPGYFLLAVVVAAGAALATIALQSWRAARARPVEALRYE